MDKSVIWPVKKVDSKLFTNRESDWKKYVEFNGKRNPAHVYWSLEWRADNTQNYVKRKYLASVDLAGIVGGMIV